MATRGIYDLVDTWSNGATAFDTIKARVTNTASAAGSDLIDLAITSGASIRFDKTGQLIISDGTNSLTFSPTIETSRSNLGVPYINALNYGLVGDNSTDNADAIDDLFAAMTTSGTVLFPAGIYKTSRTIELPFDVILLGEGTGSDGTVFVKTGNTDTLINPVIHSKGGICNVLLYGLGHVMDMSDTNNFKISKVHGSTTGSGYWFLYSNGNNFGLRLDNLQVTGGGSMLGSGVMMPSHTTGTCLDVVGCAEGIRMYGSGVSLMGGRVETNTLGIELGKDQDGVNNTLTNSIIQGFTFESNTIAMRATSATSCMFSGLTVIGNVGQSPVPPSSTGGDSSYGFVLSSVSKCLFNCMTLSNYAPNHPVISFGNVYGTHFNNVTAGNASATGTAWGGGASLLNNTTGNTFHGCQGIDWNASDAIPGSLDASAVRTLCLTGFDRLNAIKQGKNLRGIAVSVTEGATSKAYVFPPAAAGGDVDIASFTQATTGGASLVAGTTYYYKLSAVTAVGECAGAAEQSTLMGVGKNSVTVAAYGLGSERVFRLKLFRGTASGVYDGCYYLPLNTTSYLDTGAAFDIPGAETPINGAGDNSAVEPDANYAVILTPNWPTNWSITDKLTTGFTVRFGTAATAVYSTGTISSSSATVTLSGGTWPANIADGTITADAQTIAVASRTSDTVIVLESAPSAPFSVDSFTAQGYNKFDFVIMR